MKSRPEDALLLLSRRAVYALGGLLFAVALLAFVAGYLIGRGPGGGRAKEAESAAGAEVADAVALEGSLIYSSSPGQYEPDADAIVLALPVEKKPVKKLAISATSLSAGNDADSAAADGAIRALGGALVRANSDGEFQLVVPRSGDYYLLLVSQHVKRPEGEPIDVTALHALGDYLVNPSELIGAHKYYWQQLLLSGAPRPITRDFGGDGK